MSVAIVIDNFADWLAVDACYVVGSSAVKRLVEKGAVTGCCDSGRELEGFPFEPLGFL